MAAHFRGSRTAGGRLRQGRRGADRGREQPAGFGVDRTPAAAACAGCGAFSRFSGETEAEKLDPDPHGDRKSRSRRAGAVGLARGGVDLQYPRRRRRRTRRCRCPTRWCQRTAVPPSSSTPQTFQQRPRPSRTIGRCRGAGRAHAEAHRAGPARRIDRARQCQRRRRAEPADIGRRRQAGARQRSGQPAQGRQECDRDRRHTRPRTGAMRWRWRAFWPGSTAKAPPAH